MDKAREKRLKRIQRLEKQIGSEPNNAELVQELGKCHRELGNLPAAEEHFRRACTVDPLDPWSHLYLGHVHYSRDEFPSALEEFRRASELDPTEPAPWWLMGGAFLCLARNADADRSYNQAVTVDPQSKLAQKRLRRWNKIQAKRLAAAREPRAR